MAVRCAGDSGPMEQVGEKQDFECELTRHGLRHENFMLRVRRRARAASNPWNHDYAVIVTHLATGQDRVYAGGPAYRWVRRFAADLANGAYPLSAERIDLSSDASLSSSLG